MELPIQYGITYQLKVSLDGIGSQTLEMDMPDAGATVDMSDITPPDDVEAYTPSLVYQALTARNEATEAADYVSAYASVIEDIPTYAATAETAAATATTQAALIPITPVLATNLLVDPKVTPAKWALNFGSGTVVAGAEGGVRITSAGGGTFASVGPTNVGLTGLSGATYLTISADVRGAGTAQVFAQFACKDAGGVTLGNSTDSTYATPTGSWSRVKMTVKLRDNTVSTTNVQLIRSSNAANGDWVEWKNVVIETGLVDLRAYFDGDTPGARWKGEQNNSQSELVLLRSKDVTVAAEPTYFKKSGDTITSEDVHLSLVKSSNTANNKRWDIYFGSDGALSVLNKSDAGTTTRSLLRLNRDGVVELQGVKHYNGTGSPEGVLAAPPGSRYIDTNATNGAVEWTKTTGTSTTGWLVSHGDTGRRYLSTPRGDYQSGNVYLRREGNFVQLELNGCVPVAGTGYAYIFSTTETVPHPSSGLPAGFRAAPYHTTLWGYVTNNAVAPHRFSIINGDRVAWVGEGLAQGGTRPTVGFNAVFTWRTPDAWPTSLPGVAG